MTTVNDVVLIYLEDAPISFARVESILPDAKKDWYHIKLLMLQIPLQVVTWILKDEYINGLQFHMNGKKMKLEKVESPVEDLPLSNSENPSDLKTPEKIKSGKIKSEKTESEKIGAENKKEAKIISFSDFKKS
ncbi:hypothetical protein [Desulfobacula phenolica]|uniref:Uncharacterized protein n=1 Tax=Desulfobacula phenolica TaxID=90732 RepID=A0A1H2DSY1_9BACT|nr:hypothetical protein [Desulfobacula phenolica]SDT86009.1 hypothetical protein SAMN04487931_102132 [Desulfobacula phenolica]